MKHRGEEILRMEEAVTSKEEKREEEEERSLASWKSRPRITIFILWDIWGWHYFLFQPPLMGLHKDTSDRAGYNPATEHLGRADHRDRGLPAQKVSAEVWDPPVGFRRTTQPSCESRPGICPELVHQRWTTNCLLVEAIPYFYQLTVCWHGPRFSQVSSGRYPTWGSTSWMSPEYRATYRGEANPDPLTSKV